MHYINCPLCDCKNYRKLLTLKTDKVLRLLECHSSWHNTKVMCNNCGMVYQNPRLDEDEISELYTKLARSRKEGYSSETPPAEYLYWKGLKAHDDMEWLNSHIQSNGEKNKNVLDIGCAEGSLLKLFKEKGWSVSGVEPTASYAEFGRKEYGLDITDGFFTDSTFVDYSFDLVTSLNVLEHSERPVEFLKEVNKILKNSGYIYIEVPNTYKPKLDFREFIGSQHLTLFSPGTLTRMLDAASFEVIVIDDSKITLKALAKKKDNMSDGQGKQAQAFEIDSYRKIFGILRVHRRKYFFFNLTNKTRAAIKKILVIVLGKDRTNSLISILKKKNSKDFVNNQKFEVR